MKTLGDKLHFGLDYRMSDFRRPVTGYAKIWFGGNYMCTEYDPVYFDSYIFGGLKQIANIDYADVEFRDKEPLFNYFYNRLCDTNDYEIHKYLVSFATASDNFTIFAFLDSYNSIHLVWRLESINKSFKDISKPGKEIHYYSIDKEEYIVLMHEMRNRIAGAINPDFF